MSPRSSQPTGAEASGSGGGPAPDGARGAPAGTGTTLRCEGPQSQEWKVGAAALQRNLRAAVAPSTSSNYDYWWQKYEKFCAKEHKAVLSSSGTDVASFLSYLAETAAGLGGAAAAKAAIRHNFLQRRPEQASPTDSPEVGLALRGIKRRFFKPVQKKSPLKPADFLKLLEHSTLGGDFGGVWLCQLRLAAQLSIMYLTFSRYEEVAALRIKQVSKEGHNLLVLYEKGKTYQMGEARLAVMAGRPDTALDPVKVVLAYIDRLSKTPGNKKGLLFPALHSSAKGDRALDKPASYKAVLSQFKVAVVEAGVTTDPSTFGLHSMRRGGVTAAVNAGASDHAVSKQMRVAGVETVRRYATLDKSMLAATSAAIFT